MKKKPTKKLLTWATTITRQPVIYWIFAYFKEHYKLIVIDLSKQTKSKDPQQINFIGKLENQANGVTMFFVIEKSDYYF